MALTSISFQKYKAFPSSESIAIRPLTILIGRNSSGKSVIARLPLLLARAFSAQAEAPVELNFDDLDFGASFVDLIHDRSPHGAIGLGATVEQGESQTESLRTRIQYFDEYKLHIVSHFRYEHSAEGSITLTWLGTDPLREGETYKLDIWLDAPEQAELRRSFLIWLREAFLKNRLPGVRFPELNDLEEVRSMLTDRVLDWTEQWKQEGRQEGLQQGLQQGLASERQLLRRLVRRRFGEEAAESSAPILERITQPAVLEALGEALFDCPDATAWLARLTVAAQEVQTPPDS